MGVPLLVGSLSSIVAGDSEALYSQLNQPPLSPPGWVFPVVWSVLYVLMGIASYLVMSKPGNDLRLYWIQLIVNFIWPILFFQKEWYVVAFIWILLLWVLIVLTIKDFYKVSKQAAYLMVPYLIWVTFAGYLSLGVALLNM